MEKFILIRKRILITFLIFGFLMISLVGYGAKQVNTSTKQTQNNVKKKITIKVGATPVPHAEILNVVKPILEKKGIRLEIVEFTDYVQPNLKLADKELDANFFQHIPYLEDFQKSII